MTPLRLRVDVCTYRALRDGVPGVLEVLRRHRVRATFFVAFGPDSSGRAILKMLRPSFAAKMFRTNAAGTYGWATAFYGTLLPSPLIGAGLPDLVRRIRDEGHEVGLHGWNHRRWQDRLRKYGKDELRSEFDRMVGAYREALGAAPLAFAAPAWTVTTDLLGLEGDYGLRYSSDCRGHAPFRPMLEGREFALPQLPVSLPTLDEHLGGACTTGFADEILRLSAGQPDYSCLTAHAEMEGRAYAGDLDRILGGLDRPVGPLGETPLVDLPRAEIRPGRVPGRTSEVFLQKA